MAQIQSGGVYALLNAKAGNCVDLSGGDGRSIIGYEYHGGDNQKWRFQKLSQGPGWVIQNVGTGKYLSITEGAGDGVLVVGSNDPTQWDVCRDEEDSSVHRLFVLNTPFNLDLSDNGNPTPGTPVSVWGKWSGRNQCWRLQEA
ncbi:carbohydrate-binding module family 13 protein [Phlebiopsis gigantea 11061_1 CR5-6]|uniref:Carbohydrate-binding module family 13 protein n=1 Tax=Phlebiopsis gigantea (strain 11061_1 CR5-6) TaxID=745531 RepID=A0A0C3S1L8_PHLG1|nr:carbohydrate-binding module family 13 protein [Phlebiopsis gigantea 11061_1 CR5-6]